MRNEIGHNERQMQKINTFIPFFMPKPAKLNELSWTQRPFIDETLSVKLYTCIPYIDRYVYWTIQPSHLKLHNSCVQRNLKIFASHKRSQRHLLACTHNAYAFVHTKKQKRWKQKHKKRTEYRQASQQASQQASERKERKSAKESKENQINERKCT